MSLVPNRLGNGAPALSHVSSPPVQSFKISGVGAWKLNQNENHETRMRKLLQSCDGNHHNETACSPHIMTHWHFWVASDSNGGGMQTSVVVAAEGVRPPKLLPLVCERSINEAVFTLQAA